MNGLAMLSVNIICTKLSSFLECCYRDLAKLSHERIGTLSDVQYNFIESINLVVIFLQPRVVLRTSYSC